MTNEQLTELYNAANGLDPKRHNPITTERIFVAMRGAIAVEREACKLACAATPVLVPGHHEYTALSVQRLLMDAISERSNQV